MKEYKEYIYAYFFDLINNAEVAEMLTEAAHLTKFSSGESILEAGRKANYVCLIVSGLARERYLLLMKEQPELIEKAKQEHIASYLGITPSSLSRIKRDL